MHLDTYVDRLRDQLIAAAEMGGSESRAVVERLATGLEAATRLVLLEALSAAADEITSELAPGAVEVRLRSGDPTFVITRAPVDDVYADPAPSRIKDVDERGTSRLNLRLPDSLKARIEEAARHEGLSLNAWLVRAATTGLGSPGAHRRRDSYGGDSFTGWVH